MPLFHDKLRKYEKKIVDFLLDIGKIKRVNPKISEIASYLFIHENLTQKELKELTEFSMGSISTFLSVMTGTGTFQKQLIPGTHTFIYSFSGKLEELSTRGIEIALSSFSSLESYLNNKKEELKELIEQSKEGAEHLSQRIDELLDCFEIYKKIFPKMLQTSSEETQKQSSRKSFNQTKSEQKDVREIQFDPEVYLIEDEILNQFAASPMFFSRNPLFIRILGYFITRKYLTQKTLKEITGLSTGKISEEVNALLENGLIGKKKVSSKGKITYSADSAGTTLLKFTKSVIERMAEWEKDLESMKLELESNKSELENLEGYAQIYKMNEYFLNMISNYKKCIDMIDILL